GGTAAILCQRRDEPRGVKSTRRTAATPSRVLGLARFFGVWATITDIASRAQFDVQQVAAERLVLRDSQGLLTFLLQLPDLLSKCAAEENSFAQSPYRELWLETL